MENCRFSFRSRTRAEQTKSHSDDKHKERLSKKEGQFIHNLYLVIRFTSVLKTKISIFLQNEGKIASKHLPEIAYVKA